VKKSARWPVYVALFLLVAFGIIFVVEFIGASENPVESEPPVTLAADTYVDIVTPLLANADPQNGEALLTKYECVACHRAGAENGIAPPYTGIAERAATRRPPLTAAAYIYESIIHPTAYIVDGFSSAMPQNYSERLSERELGDIIAYLLTPDAR
jgi:mono/diheme cytochrome c family protein